MTARGPIEQLAEGRAMSAPLRVFLDAAATLRADPDWLVTAADPLGGALLEDETEAEVDDGALDAVLARIDDADAAPAAHEAAARRAGRGLAELLALPRPVRDAALEALKSNGWRSAAPGLRVLPIMEDGGARLELLRIEPGWGPPAHDHAGEELTLVVAGAYTDQSGRYGPGDISVKCAGDVHRPVAEPGAPCYALAVSSGPLQFQGLLGVAQRLLRLN